LILKRKNFLKILHSKGFKVRVAAGSSFATFPPFRTFTKVHGEKTQAEMAELWQGDISARTISRALAKIGFTRKKRHMATANGMKQNERSLSP
jgi:predicted RNA binding protein YcfA (HicA-like mRNA interferase family)